MGFTEFGFMGMGFWEIALLLLVPALFIRVFLHFEDKRRIQSAAVQNGWQDVVVSWCPFAPGWFFEQGERNYLVTYRDENGDKRQRYCKTGLLTGVFWRDENT
jgi:hypothetical protein